MIAKIRDYFGLNNTERPFEDLILMRTLLTLFILFLTAIPFDILNGLSTKANIINTAVSIGLAIMYLFARNNKYIKVVRHSFLILAQIGISIFWIYTGGSNGPTPIMIVAFLLILVFLLGRNALKRYIFFMAVNTLVLFYIDIKHPELISPFGSTEQKSYDILLVLTSIFILELPLLAYARDIIFKERNNALKSEQAKTSLITNLSHELRTPMNAILGFTELLEDPEIEEIDRNFYLKIINQNGRTLMNLMNNIINLSKLDENQAQVFYSKCSAYELLSYTYETIKPLSKNVDIEIINTLSQSNDIILESDNNLLFQILINLAYNSVKFTQEGHITLSAKASNKYVSFMIQDTGCGIPKEQQPEIFDRFRQADSTGSLSPANGAGLGLAICYGITKLLKGGICFESEVGKGTTFHLQIPLKAPKASKVT